VYARALMLWACVVAVALSANPDLEKAVRLVGDLQYAEAQGALDAALKRTGNDRDTLVHIYELQGIVYGTLNQATKAAKAFQTMLVLDPDHKPGGDNPPRVMTPFYEARGRAADLGKLDAKPLTAAVAGGRVAQLAVEVTADPLKMVKKVRFHFKVDDKPWADPSAEVVGKNASVNTDGYSVKWWAQVLGDRDAVLVEIGSDAGPRQEGSPAPVVSNDIKVAPRDDVAAPPLPPPTTARASVSEGPSTMRVASLGLMGAGVVALGVGVALGVLSFVDRNAVNNATRNQTGVVTGIKQTDAYALDATVRWAAPAANVLFAVGGALALGGVLLFILSPSSSGSLALVPSGPGLSLAGSF
jgi:hypothetical protein